MKHKNYKVLIDISLRSSMGSDDFIHWYVGEIFGPKGKDYPDHAPIEEWLLFGQLEEIPTIEYTTKKTLVREEIPELPELEVIMNGED